MSRSASRSGAENFFLFGLTTPEVVDAPQPRRGHARAAIEASPVLQRVLEMIGDGRFSYDEPGRYRGLVDRLWNNDYFLVASDFDSYCDGAAPGRRRLGATRPAGTRWRC